VLLKLIIGLQKPDSGSIRVHDADITRLERAELNDVRKKVGFLFQEAALDDSLTIEENVAFPLRRHTAMSSADRRGRVRDLLSRVGMDHDSTKRPAQISGGMKKRGGLARALDPDILLFDEPTAGLDPITAGEIEDLIQQARLRRRDPAGTLRGRPAAAAHANQELRVEREGHVRPPRHGETEEPEGARRCRTVSRTAAVRPAVVVASHGMKGDAEEARVLTQGRALVVRDYLVERFKMDDARLKTMGLGKQLSTQFGDDGTVEIRVYPAGSSAPLARSSR
jgi:predicted ABC-type transport system involved in lysophospholipase L1 biosynthesis ATPase subunit